MQIHELKSIKKRVQRVGRSGKRGSYSGRGTKGQKSRSGRRLRPAERDLIMRIPKQRGFANQAKSDRPIVINLTEIVKVFKKAPATIDREALQAAGLIRKGYRGVIKLLGDGELAFAVTVKGLKTSASAKAKIKKAGGTIS